MYSIELLVVLLFAYPTIVKSSECEHKGTEDLPGECVSFNRGGDTGLHWYTCCNNLGDPDEHQPYCASFTYQGGLGEKSLSKRMHLLGVCGANGYNAGVGCRRQYGQHGKTFRCGGCRGQYLVDSYCLKNFLRAVPGFCWRYTNCFETTCRIYDSYLRDHKSNASTAIEIPVRVALRHYDLMLRARNSSNIARHTKKGVERHPVRDVSVLVAETKEAKKSLKRQSNIHRERKSFATDNAKMDMHDIKTLVKHARRGNRGTSNKPNPSFLTKT